ncbi:MAG: PIN domain-containing protein [Actinomycetota bacterium]|nr:PIN domain-containing protein [Actinomycetota bacterium]
MKLVDANVIIRYLTCDDQKKAEACRALLEKTVAGRAPSLFMADIAIAEIVWVLESVYKLSKDEIKDKLETVLNTPNIDFQNKQVLTESVVIYATYNIDFIDAYQAVLAKHRQISAIYSYDTDFDKLAGVSRIEP